MKKLISIIILLLIVGCKTVDLNRSIEFYGLDFTPYSEKNFLFTTETYTGAYSGIALLEVQIFPSIKKISIPNSQDDWQIGALNPSEGLDTLYKHAINLGADGIINFKTRTIERLNGSIIYKGIGIEGFAIKRENK